MEKHYDFANYHIVVKNDTHYEVYDYCGVEDKHLLVFTFTAVSNLFEGLKFRATKEYIDTPFGKFLGETVREYSFNIRIIWSNIPKEKIISALGYFLPTIDITYKSIEHANVRKLFKYDKFTIGMYCIHFKNGKKTYMRTRDNELTPIKWG
jgi:hypothetical protein